MYMPGLNPHEPVGAPRRPGTSRVAAHWSRYSFHPDGHCDLGSSYAQAGDSYTYGLSWIGRYSFSTVESLSAVSR